MKLYRLRQTAFWGDYGTILTCGLHPQRDEQTGNLVIERAGPFAPPMIFSIEALVGFIVLVTHSFRQELEKANFGELGFRPTIKKHIVSIPWETWDRRARLPWDANASPQGERPVEGEPENYILEQNHSPEAASKMEDIWEFSAPVLPCKIDKRERLRAFHYRWYITSPKGENTKLFRPPGKGHVLFVDQSGRDWFEREGEGWIDFDEVTVI